MGLATMTYVSEVLTASIIRVMISALMMEAVKVFETSINF
jgi:hypothetical protein